MKIAIAGMLLLLTGIVNAADQPIIPLASFMIVGDDARKDGLTVKGTWIDEDTNPNHRGDKPADEINSSKFQCFPSQHECYEARSSIMDGQYLTVDITVWHIDYVDAHKIIATTYYPNPPTLIIDRQNKQVTVTFTQGDHAVTWRMIGGLDASRLNAKNR
jgi:hypothetical protein